MQREIDAAVVGGGLSGLAAAICLARNGKRVTVFEQADRTGGRARTNRFNGFYFNLGPHALYRGGAGIGVLREFGIEPRGGIPPATGAVAVAEGSKHTLPSGPLSLLSTSLLTAGEKIETAKLLAALPRVDPQPLYHSTLGEWVDANVSRPRVREFLHAVFRVATYVNAPHLMSAGVALLQVQKALKTGVLYLDSGWQSLVDALERAARAAGVEIETGQRVEAIEVSATGAVAGVRLADGRVASAIFAVVAASPRATRALLGNAVPAWLDRFVEGAVPVRAACLDVGLNRLPDPRVTFALGVDRAMYLSVHSAWARLAPEGRSMIHVAKYLAPGEQTSAEAAERELEELLDLVQPGWREQVEQRRFLPEMTVSWAIPQADRGGTTGRPKPAVEEVRGLYVAGDWVGDEGLLADAALSSARQAARSILDSDLIEAATSRLRANAC